MAIVLQTLEPNKTGPAWMDSLYGWAPATIKTKSAPCSHPMNSGFAAIHPVGIIARELHTGNIIQLESRTTGGLLRVHNKSRKIDFDGIHGKQAQFLVTREGEDIVTLRCILNSQNFLVLRNGYLFADGKGDPQCRFRYHVADGHYMKFEAVQNPKRFISIDRSFSSGDSLRSYSTMSARSSEASGMQGHFSVIVTGHTNQLYAT